MPFVKLKDKQPEKYADTVFYYPRFDTCNRHRFLSAEGMPEDTEWLDESAPSIIEENVKDLDWEENVLSGRKTAYAANAKYEVLPLIGVFVLRITDYKTNGWGEEQFLTASEAIAEANRQNKEYILSQLK